MILAYIQITIDLPYIHSLKGRRRVLNSIKERLKKGNLSILDISSEYAKEAAIAVALLTHNSRDLHKTIGFIESILDRFIGEIEYSLEYEIV